MDRLTARTETGAAYLVNVKSDEQEVDSPYKNTLKCILDCFERLAAYEDAGLTPGDIKDLQAICERNGLAKYVDLIVRAKWQMIIDNERSIEQDGRIEQLEKQLAESQRQLRAAVEEMKRIADTVRDAHCDETCCFACKFDYDTSITDTGDYACECPGFERGDCFEWRGPEEGEGE